MQKARLMPRLAWGALAFNMAVIVWGAFVRASGSGAGCGQHWPLCNGQVIPHTGLLTTAIEFIHRVSSGLCLPLAAAVAWAGVREYPRGHRVRRAGWAVLGFTLSEALIGAGLVLLRYVDKDQSLGRAVSIVLHLTNTFGLLAALAVAALWSRYPNEGRARRPDALAWSALAATTWLAATGALTALGDTLFRSRTLLGGVASDFASHSHFLLRLRVLHPALAVATAAYLFLYAERTQDRTPRLAQALKAAIAAQLAVGVVNLILLAPVPMQLLHLAAAEGVWVTLVLTVVASLEIALPAHQAHEPAHQAGEPAHGAEEPGPGVEQPAPATLSGLTRAGLLPALETFAAQLPPGARVFCVESEARAWLAPRGFELEVPETGRDLRMLSPRRATFDGAWLGTELKRFPIEESQRVVATFFQALKPGRGALFASHSHPETAFASMLRQNGFAVLLQGQSDEGDQAVLARRI